MIIKNVCLLLEALSMVFCLYYLYGEKFKLDIATISYLSTHMIIMTAINYLELSKAYTMIIYPIIIVYCGIRFGFRIKTMAVNVVLCVVLIGGMQLVVATPICYLLDMHHFVNFDLLMVSIVVFAISAFGLPFLKVYKLSTFLQDKERVLVISIVICLAIILIWLLSYKKIDIMELNNTLVLFICIAFILILSVQLVKYKIKAKEVETELRMQKLYADSFQGLIDNIRLRQHEFNNHINMLHSLQYKYHTYEELAGALDNYVSPVLKENRFHKLLSCGNSVIIGFLYGRFNEFDKEGINVSYQVSVDELEVGVPIYKIVEILGDLMNNAVEALLADGERKKLHVSIVESDRFYIEVRNESPYIDYKELGNFFAKDYSKKGENRGLGLYNVKQICQEYGLEISCQMVKIGEDSWLSFKIGEAKSIS